MIGYLEGVVLQKNNNQIILSCNNIGFEINVLDNLNVKINDKKGLLIKTIVRENDISLYGFNDMKEKQMFEKLISVNGIGPKAAMNILSFISVEELMESIINENIEKMTKIKGIGKKGAEKIIFSLKDKFNKEKTSIPSKGIDEKSNELVQAITFMGYSQEEANKVVDKIYNPEKTIQELIKIALVELKK